MKKITSVMLMLLGVISLLVLSPTDTPVLAQEGTTTFYYLPLISRQLPLNQIAVGWDYTCAVTPSGGVKCWGHNQDGSLGDGTNQMRANPVNVVNLNAQVTAIDAEYFQTCALTVKGGVKCWGNNLAGQLGDGTLTNRFAPVDVIGLTSGVKALSVGSDHACALTDEGGVKCWGENRNGQLGDGTRIPRRAPVQVIGLTSGVKAISAGNRTTCALTEAGGVKCWGSNEYGALGYPVEGVQTQPVDVTGLTSGVTAISTGEFQSCVITSTKDVKCWGWDWNLVIGRGWMPFNPTPTTVPGLTGVTAIWAGVFGDCAMNENGGMQCWGDNTYGEMGSGTKTLQLAPVNVSGLASGVTALVTAEDHTCALLTSGTAKCWGRNQFYQLGTGSNSPLTYTTPVDVLGFP